MTARVMMFFCEECQKGTKDMPNFNKEVDSLKKEGSSIKTLMKMDIVDIQTTLESNKPSFANVEKNLEKETQTMKQLKTMVKDTR